MNFIEIPDRSFFGRLFGRAIRVPTSNPVTPTPRERWSASKRAFVSSPAVDAFIADIAEVCRRHGMSIGHEDEHGGFIVQRFDESTLEWLAEAEDRTTEDRE